MGEKLLTSCKERIALKRYIPDERQRRLLATLAEPGNEQVHHILLDLLSEGFDGVETKNRHSFGVRYALDALQEGRQVRIALVGVHMLFIHQAGLVEGACPFIFFNRVGAIAEPEKPDVDVARLDFTEAGTVDR